MCKILDIINNKYLAYFISFEDPSKAGIEFKTKLEAERFLKNYIYSENFGFRHGLDCREVLENEFEIIEC